MVGKFLAAVAAATLSAAPVAAQPSETAGPRAERNDGNGLDVAYFVLPLLVLIALLVAITKDDEGPVSP